MSEKELIIALNFRMQSDDPDADGQELAETAADSILAAACS